MPVGLTAQKIEVEIDTTRGKPGLHIIGLASKAVNEARERITSALLNSGIKPKSLKTIVNLTPANIKKTGTGFDIAIALGLVLHTHSKNIDLEDSLFVGELSLDGSIKPVDGCVSILRSTHELGTKKVFLSSKQVLPTHFFPDVTIRKPSSLNQLVSHILENKTILPASETSSTAFNEEKTMTGIWDQVLGQSAAKRACQVAVAGKHHLLMVGPPGVGKTMLARSLPDLLPPLTRSQVLEKAALTSLHQSKADWSNKPLFRKPHHTSTIKGLLGGGWPIKPGEVVMAHNGVLFLDELTEFSRTTLESLRQPLESREVVISRAHDKLVFPADCLVVAAANPCACGYYGSSRSCHCQPGVINRYRSKLSSPLIDRFGLQVQLEPTKSEQILSPSNTNTTSDVAKSVLRARERQKKRFAKHNLTLMNGELEAKHIQTTCLLSQEAGKILSKASAKLGLSARSIHQAIRVAQTICDLKETQFTEIQASHLSEALQFRLKL